MSVRNGLTLPSHRALYAVQMVLAVAVVAPVCKFIV